MGRKPDLFKENEAPHGELRLRLEQLRHQERLTEEWRKKALRWEGRCKHFEGEVRWHKMIIENLSKQEAVDGE